MKGTQVCSNEGFRPFPRGDNYKITKIHWQNLKTFLLKNHWANFNQTWHTAFLGKVDLSLFKWRAPPFSKGEIIIHWQNLKNRLLNSHLTNFIQTWHKASLGEGDSNFFKWRASPFSKGSQMQKYIYKI